MIITDDNEVPYKLYVRDPKTGMERVNWSLLLRDSVCGPDDWRLRLFLRLSYLQVDLWLKKWRRWR